jgi:hypothetical protein
MVDVAAGDFGLVAVGFEATDKGIFAAVWTSPDGFFWTRIPHDQATFGGSRNWWGGLTSVAAIGDGIVTVGIDGDDGIVGVWTSHDGITWTRLSAADAVLGVHTGLRKVIAGGPGIVMLGHEHDAVAMWVAIPTDTDERAPAAPTD